MPAAAHRLGCRQEDLGRGCCRCLTAQLPLPALGAGVRGPGALCFDFQDRSALLGSQHCCALICRTATGRWALVRRVVQAPRDLLPNLVCPSAAQLGAKGSPVVGLHTGVSVPLVLYPSCSSGLSIPSLAQPGEGEAVALTPGHLGSARLQHQLGRAKGFLLPKGVPWYRGLVPKGIPVPYIPGLCPGEPRSSRRQRAGATAASPSRGRVFPNHLNPAAFEQTLLRGATREGRSRGKPRSSHCSRARRGERGTC